MLKKISNGLKKSAVLSADCRTGTKEKRTKPATQKGGAMSGGAGGGNKPGGTPKPKREVRNGVIYTHGKKVG